MVEVASVVVMYRVKLETEFYRRAGKGGMRGGGGTCCP